MPESLTSSYLGGAGDMMRREDVAAPLHFYTHPLQVSVACRYNFMQISKSFPSFSK
ncbi:unnamed protein product [Onchocerca flexuosa]|uniref:Uncharacterized protein n=1 Tax=Onchocerca flexuosa TaxID=387005 RepID=A0A183HMD9_9BILA|nr:unnamed protein product [Onchocerca flexuosa]